MIAASGLERLPLSPIENIRGEPNISQVASAHRNFSREYARTMALRMAQKTDASSIAAISIEVWIGTYLRSGVSAFFADYALKEFSPFNIEKHIADPAQFIMVSQNENGIDGFIRVSADSTPPVEGCSHMQIVTFYVQPRHRGKGIGTDLLNAAFEHCRAVLAKSVWLTTNAENAPAIAYYLERGFKHVGETYFRIENEGFLNNVYSYDLG